MRTFNFKVRNIGQEKYLTYIMGEECELDEDILDYCEENNPKELISIIYEEDDDYDYLTYDVSGKTTISELIQGEVKSSKVLPLIRNIGNSIISVKEQAIHLSYILMNREYMYVDTESMDISFICLPVESDAAVMAEFKGFIRQLIANMKFDVSEDLSYVGKLLTYINSDNFNLRGLIGLSEALMEEMDISYEQVADIDSDGVEVVNAESPATAPEKTENISDFMNEKDDAPLPEIGDDETDDEEEDTEEDKISADEELASILPTKTEEKTEEKSEKKAEDKSEEESEKKVEDKPEVKAEEKPEEKTEEKTEEKSENKPEVKAEQKKNKNKEDEQVSFKIADAKEKETDVNLLKSRMEKLVGNSPRPVKAEDTIKSMEELESFLNNKPPVIKKTQVKVNRAALIQSAAEHEAENSEAEAAASAQPVEETGTTNELKVPVIDEVYGDETPKSNSVLSMKLEDVSMAAPVTLATNVPKAVPYLIRVNTEERIMLNKVTFKIGKATRGVDYTVGGNGAISRQHAIIIQKDGVCYIKDNKSTNHTYVNNKEVEEGTEEILTHDSMIKLGDEEFLFKLR